METVALVRPDYIPSDFKVVCLCPFCDNPIAYGKGIGYSTDPENIRLADGTKPKLGASIFVACSQCNAKVSANGAWQLIGDGWRGG